MKLPEALFFDMDGVIIDTEKDGRENTRFAGKWIIMVNCSRFPEERNG